jgi:hypothetical protein
MLASAKVTEISLSVCRPVILQVDRRTVELQLALACKHFTRNSTRGVSEEIIVPVLHSLNYGQMLARVLLRDDLRTDRIQPFVAVGVIEMPVRVDQVRDRVAADIGQGLGDLRARYTNAGIDKNFTVGAGQHGNVAAGALEYADIISQLMRHDGRYRRAVLDQADDAACFRKGLARCQPAICRGECRAPDAAEAKAASR